MKQGWTRGFAIAVLLVLAACSSTDSRAKQLQFGMDRAEVIRLLGDSYTVAGARQDPGGATMEVLMFTRKKDSDFYVFLRDGKLAQWGDQQAIQSAQ